MRSLRERSFSFLCAYITELDCFGPYRSELCHNSSRLTVMLDLVGRHPEARDKPFSPTPITIDTVHQMNFAPARWPMWAGSDQTRYMRHISFTFDGDAIASLIGEDLDPEHAFTPRPLFSDHRLLQIARLFEIEIEADEQTDTLYADTLALALLVRLARLSRPQCPAPRGGLAAYQLRLVTEYLYAHLDSRIGLRELANVVHLSRSQFGRAFRISTGMPPHQWLLRERVRKAKEHLLGSNRSLGEIALLVGFADQAHFTRAFARIAGATPGSWRRERRT